MVGGANRAFATHGRPDQSINVLDRLDLRSDDTHPLHDTRLWPSSSIDSTVYNTVILGRLLLTNGADTALVHDAVARLASRLGTGDFTVRWK
jgi:hypothetical protein